jgi:hypothetical protein
VTSAERPPRVAIASGTRAIAVLWIGAAAAPAGPRMLLSRSIDGGKTFAAPIAVSAADAPGDPRLGLAGRRPGRRLPCVVAGRPRRRRRHGGRARASPRHRGRTAGAGAAAAPPRPAMRQDLYHAVIAADGSVAETRLATDVCFCCKTATLALPAPLAGATLPGDVLVAWRHIYPNSERDIALVVRHGEDRDLRAAGPRRARRSLATAGVPGRRAGARRERHGRLHAVWPSIADAAATDAPEKRSSTRAAPTGARSRRAAVSMRRAAAPRIRRSWPAPTAMRSRCGTPAMTAGAR